MNANDDDEESATHLSLSLSSHAHARISYPHFQMDLPFETITSYKVPLICDFAKRSTPKRKKREQIVAIQRQSIPRVGNLFFGKQS